MTRRQALQYLASISVTPALPGQELIGEPAGRVAPLSDLVNVFEVRAMAKRKLAENVFATVGGEDRRALERITFRPRLMVNVSKLDLTAEVLGAKMFAPIVVAPIANQQAYHPDGEVAMVRGASAAQAVAVVSSRSSRPLTEVAAAAKTPLWFQLYPDPDINITIASAQHAVKEGFKAVCLTVGTPYQPDSPSSRRLQLTGNLKLDWTAVGKVRQSLKTPLLLKGIMSPEEAQLAAKHDVDGIVVSNHGAMFTTGFADPIEMLPSIVEAAGPKTSVLIDGSFRRGSDILKALALGARAVLIGRPMIWGLTAYGAEGVRGVLEMLQSELARNMAMCGKPDIKSIDRSLVKVHRR